VEFLLSKVNDAGTALTERESRPPTNSLTVGRDNTVILGKLITVFEIKDFSAREPDKALWAAGRMIHNT
jgi:hypothetical protein